MASGKVEQSAFQFDKSEFADFRQALKLMAKLIPDEVSQGAFKASTRLATAARPRLAASSNWGHLVAPSIRVSKAREPLIKAGGRGQAREKVGPNDANTYGDIFFGAEYGVKSDIRWPGHPWKGSGSNAGYGLWPAVRSESDAIYRLWITDLWSALERKWST